MIYQLFQRCRIVCTSSNSLAFTIPRTRPGLQEELSSLTSPSVANPFQIRPSNTSMNLESTPHIAPLLRTYIPLLLNPHSLHRCFVHCGISGTPRNGHIHSPPSFSPTCTQLLSHLLPSLVYYFSAYATPRIFIRASQVYEEEDGGAADLLYTLRGSGRVEPTFLAPTTRHRYADPAT
jgi:hypothetical protein